MTLGELIEQLESFRETLDDTLLIVISKDAEGNNHSPLFEISEGGYGADSTWSGDWLDKAYFTDGSAEHDGYDMSDYVSAICLWPVN